MKTSVRNEGFEGILLPGNGSLQRVMIVMSGSNGGMKLTRRCAEFYHRNGIAALALALFATKGTQPYLDRVPVEYVENAIRWLKERGFKRIGIDGMSKGSELALIAAAQFQDIDCVIARVPSYFVSEGLIGRGKNKRPSTTSCWSCNGKELPYAKYGTRKFELLGMLLKEKQLNILPFNSNKQITEESMIPIENIQAPILLLSSVNDTVWPSYESATYIEKRLKEANFGYEFRHVALRHISHAMVTKLPILYKIAFRAERIDANGCRADREILKHELLDWVKSH